MRKILILSGSARSNGETNRIVEKFAVNAREDGAEVEVMQLRDLKIKECLACDYCASHNHCCVQKDDMEIITEKLKKCDTIVFATPVYYGAVSALLKTVIDRFYALGSANMSIKDSYLITVAGRNDNHATDPVLNYYNYLVDFMGWNNLGTICLRAR